MSAVEPLQDGEEVTDMTGKKWKLVKLLSQTTTALIYKGETSLVALQKVKDAFKTPVDFSIPFFFLFQFPKQFPDPLPKKRIISSNW